MSGPTDSKELYKLCVKALAPPKSLTNDADPSYIYGYQDCLVLSNQGLAKLFLSDSLDLKTFIEAETHKAVEAFAEKLLANSVGYRLEDGFSFEEAVPIDVIVATIQAALEAYKS